MKAPATYYLKLIFGWMLLLQMVNISIEPPQIKYTGEATVTPVSDESVDKIESIYEYVSEGLLDTDVPDNEEEDELEKTNKSIQLFYAHPSVQVFGWVPPPLKYQAYYPLHYLLPYEDPISPPPRLA